MLLSFVRHPALAAGCETADRGLARVSTKQAPQLRTMFKNRLAASRRPSPGLRPGAARRAGDHIAVRERSAGRVAVQEGLKPVDRDPGLRERGAGAVLERTVGLAQVRDDRRRPGKVLAGSDRGSASPPRRCRRDAPPGDRWRNPRRRSRGPARRRALRAPRNRPPGPASCGRPTSPAAMANQFGESSPSVERSSALTLRGVDVVAMASLTPRSCASSISRSMPGRSLSAPLPSRSR